MLRNKGMHRTSWIVKAVPKLELSKKALAATNYTCFPWALVPPSSGPPHPFLYLFLCPLQHLQTSLKGFKIICNE